MWIILTKRLPVESAPPHLSMLWSTWWPPESEIHVNAFAETLRHAWNADIGELYEEAPYAKKSGFNLFAHLMRHYINKDIYLLQKRFEEMGAKALTPNEQQVVTFYPQFEQFIESNKDFPSRHGTILGRATYEHNWLRARKIIANGQTIRVFPDEFGVLQAANMLTYIESGYFDFIQEQPAEGKIVEDILFGEDRIIYDAALVDGATKQQALLTAMGMRVDLEDAEFPPAIGWYKPKQELLELLPDPNQVGVLTEVNHARRAAAQRRKMELPR